MGLEVYKREIWSSDKIKTPPKKKKEEMEEEEERRRRSEGVDMGWWKLLKTSIFAVMRV